MLLNAENILKFLKPNGMGKKAQVGFDLTLKSISKINGGRIGVTDNNIMRYEEVVENTDGSIYLEPGVYSLTFHQSIKLDGNHAGFVVHRSSLQRVGAIISSGVFDPGFECEEIGATMFLHNRVIIEKGARVAQLLIHECQESELYNGSYQGKKDLK